MSRGFTSYSYAYIQLEADYIEETDLLPWHMSLFSHEGVLYTIITCAEGNTKGNRYVPLKQYLGKFDVDSRIMHIYRRPLIALNSYRGSACVLSNGLFILYSTTVNEKINGANSIDGRDIVMTYMMFSDLLNMLEDEKR